MAGEITVVADQGPTVGPSVSAARAANFSATAVIPIEAQNATMVTIPATGAAETATMALKSAGIAAISATELIVYLNEERVIPMLFVDDQWYLDTGANNHMIGSGLMFTIIDEHVKGMVKFGDGSVIEIQGRGSILFV